MKILVMGDKAAVIRPLKDSVRESKPDAQIYEAKDTAAALECMKQKKCDVVFMDTCLPGNIDGIGFAKKLQEVNPSINIIFTTDNLNFIKEAFDIHASGYLLMPLTKTKVDKELGDLRYAPAEDRSDLSGTDKRMRVQCFGNFEVFVDGSPVAFKYNRTKELFAYLVDRRGAVVSGEELCAVLWEDDCSQKAVKSYLRNLVADIKSTFRALGTESVLIKEWNAYAVRPETFWCDFYEFEKGNSAVIPAFCNEYMSQYSWAEFKIGEITKLRRTRLLSNAG